MARGYHGPEDPDKGKPYRHTRAKIELMLGDLVRTPDMEVMLQILGKVTDRHPVAVLDAVTEVMSDQRLGECGLPGPCTKHGNCACDDIRPAHEAKVPEKRKR